MKRIIIYIDDHVFDVTDYANQHPGGSYILKKYNLEDATKAFNDIKGHNDGYAIGLLDEYYICKFKDFNLDEHLKKFEKD